jgi:hypothetical protein
MQEMPIARRDRTRLRAKARGGVQSAGLEIGHGLLEEALEFYGLHSSEKEVGAATAIFSTIPLKQTPVRADS